jgi:hypothetical protein
MLGRGAEPDHLRYLRRSMRVGTPGQSGAHEERSELEPSRRPAPPPTGETAGAGTDAAGFVTSSHEILFEPLPRACDVCDARLSAHDASDPDLDEGSGLFVWARNGDVHYEEPPLCPSCAAAITMTALLRWESEEDEG